jgi:hypothetical protein
MTCIHCRAKWKKGQHLFTLTEMGITYCSIPLRLGFVNNAERSILENQRSIPFKRSSKLWILNLRT